MMIHTTAIIEPGAELGSDVSVGAFAVIERGARIGKGCRIHHHAVIGSSARLGEENVVYPFAVVGSKAQHKRYEGPGANLEIGSGNVIREHVTIHAGTERPTRIGAKNMFMVGAHVGHDAIVGSHCTIANSAQLAGHVELADHVVMGGLSGLAQFVKVGEGAFVAAGAMVERDVPPYVIVQGDRARIRALNVVGLKRMGVPEESIRELRRVFRALYVSKQAAHSDDPFAKKLLASR